MTFKGHRQKAEYRACGLGEEDAPGYVGGRLPFRVYYCLRSGTLRRSAVGPAVLITPVPLTGKSAQGGCLSEYFTDCGLARSDGPWWVLPCSPSPGPDPAQVGTGRLPFRVYYCLRSGALRRSAVGPAVLTTPGPLKSAPGGCLSKSITDYSLAHSDNFSLQDPPCSPALAHSGRYEAAARYEDQLHYFGSMCGIRMCEVEKRKA